MSRVIVLSNRVKLPTNSQGNNQDNGSAGGLAVAVFNALSQNSGKGGGVWLGWNGKVDDTLTPTADNVFNHYRHPPTNDLTGEFAELNLPALPLVTYVTTAFSPAQYRHFYCGFANNVLWALLHDRADLVEAMTQDGIDTDFAMYQQVNSLFAKQLQQIAEPDDVIWVHDYHFFGVADACRKLGMTNRIGFFLHIPFAPSEVWQLCPHADILLTQLAEYDVIGVQTQADKRHCQTVMKPILAKTANQPLIETYPIGVDVATITRQIAPKIADKSLSNAHLTQIVAVDRVDYSKGIIRRLQAYAHFLHSYPEYQGKIQLVQIAIPSRLDVPVYRALYEQVKQLVAQIQQTFATADWQPIRYSETVLGHDKLMGLFFDSQICWVNSLKDGMNLVAKEYITAQHPANAGVLMLSKYAGASEQMAEAIIIDPYDEQNLVESLHMALTMTHAERQARYQSLMTGLREQNLLTWQTNFLQDLMVNYSQLKLK